MKLTATYRDNYPKVKKDETGATVLNEQGKPVVYTVFVYTLTGDADALADYRATQGDNYRTSESGEPLFFAVTPSATDICSMRKNLGGKNAGKWGLDTGQFRKDKAIVEMAGGNLGTVIAQSVASRYVAPAHNSLLEKLQSMPQTTGAENLGDDN
jgi:hypothetical protein